MTNVYFGSEIYNIINRYVAEQQFSSIVVLVDTNTEQYCLPIFETQTDFEFKTICIKPGESHKTLDTTHRIWETMIALETDRNSLFINLGGGVVTDMGGFVALTYKRGLSFINIPTTLLAMVDASIGGKTGIDFKGLKNQIGIIAPADMVCIDPMYLKTLPKKELASGMGEVFKYGLISNAKLWGTLTQNKELTPSLDIIKQCVTIKQEIVSRDLNEKGERKILNFGHTIGHAIESYFLMKPNGINLRHGEAVAMGMMMSLYLSHLKAELPIDEVKAIQNSLKCHFTMMNLTKDDIASIKVLLKHDKKNHANKLRFVLLEAIGKAIWDVEVSLQDIDLAFEQYNAVLDC